MASGCKSRLRLITLSFYLELVLHGSCQIHNASAGQPRKIVESAASILLLLCHAIASKHVVACEHAVVGLG